jgi:hypothetical protein
MPFKEHFFGCVLGRRLPILVKGKNCPWPKNMNMCIACAFGQDKAGFCRVGIEGLYNLEVIGHEEQ